MDESWRMRMGMQVNLPNYPHRRYAHEDDVDDPLDPEHFKDVFGGPPRTILSRQFTTTKRSSSSTSLSSTSSSCYLYDGRAEKLRRDDSDHVYRNSSTHQRRRAGNLYGDNILYGWDDQSVLMRSRSRSKASSSSVLSSEELSPLRSAVNNRVRDDASLFTSKLSPMNVFSGWNPTKTQHNNRKSPPVFTENSSNYCCYYPFGSSQRITLPETISPKLTSQRSFKASADDLHLNSPSSPISSVSPSDQEQKTCKIEDEISTRSTEERLEADEPTMISYVSNQMNLRDRVVTCESDYVDEAVQWMKEKFQSQCLEIKHKLLE